MFDISKLQDISWRQSAYFSQMYAPYAASFLNMLFKKLKYNQTAFQENLEHVCKIARHPKERMIYFHHFNPYEKIHVHSAHHSVTVDEILRYTNVLKVFQNYLGPHFKVRVIPISNPNFAYSISLHFYP